MLFWGGRPLILGDPEAPSPPPIWKQKLIKGGWGGGNPYRKKKKGGKERENNALFSIKINKMQYIQISHRPGPWERRVRPSQAEGGRKEGVSSGLGRELLGPVPSHHSILPMTIRREGSGSDLPQPQSCEEQDYSELRSRVGGGEGGGGGGGRGGGAGRRVGAHTTGLIPLSGGLRPSLPARR